MESTFSVNSPSWSLGSWKIMILIGIESFQATDRFASTQTFLPVAEKVVSVILLQPLTSKTK